MFFKKKKRVVSTLGSGIRNDTLYSLLAIGAKSDDTHRGELVCLFVVILHPSNT